MRKTKIPIRDNKHLENSLCFKNIMSTMKGCKVYYNTLINKSTQPKCCIHVKWEEKLEDEFDWKTCFWYASRIHDIKIKWFQLRIIHRCIGTNVILKEMGVRNNDLCNFCNTTKDSIQPMFWQCNHVQKFWQLHVLTNTINGKCHHAFNMHISESLALLGLDKNVKVDSTLYFIILLAKQYIYNCKFFNSKPVLHVFVRRFKNRYETEEYIARKTFTYNHFITNWSMYKPIFE